MGSNRWIVAVPSGSDAAVVVDGSQTTISDLMSVHKARQIGITIVFRTAEHCCNPLIHLSLQCSHRCPFQPTVIVSAVGNALYDASGRRTRCRGRRVGSVRRVVQCRTRCRGPTRRERTTRRTVSYSTTLYDTVRHCTTQYDTVRHCTTQYDTVRHSTTQYDTVRHSTT